MPMWCRHGTLQALGGLTSLRASDILSIGPAPSLHPGPIALGVQLPLLAQDSTPQLRLAPSPFPSLNIPATTSAGHASQSTGAASLGSLPPQERGGSPYKVGALSPFPVPHPGLRGVGPPADEPEALAPLEEVLDQVRVLMPCIVWPPPGVQYTLGPGPLAE